MVSVSSTQDSISNRVVALLSLLSCITHTTANPAPRVATIPIASESSVFRRDDGTINLNNYAQSVYSTLEKYEPCTDDGCPVVNDPGTSETIVTARDTVKHVRRADRIAAPEPQAVKVELSPLWEEGARDWTTGLHTGSLTFEDRDQPGIFPMIFDTGTPRLAVPSRRCLDAGTKAIPNAGCNGLARYYELGRRQPTHVKDISKAGNGMVMSGDIYKDEVNVGGLVARDQTIISIIAARDVWRKGAAYLGSQTVGTVGLGLTPNDDFPSFFETLVKQGSLRSPEVSFYFGREKTFNVGGSQMTLGGRDGSLYVGDFVTCPSHPASWIIQTAAIMVNGKVAQGATGLITFVDTGAPHIVVGPSAGDSIAALLPGGIEMQLIPPPPAVGKPEDYVVVYAFRCEDTPTIEMVIMGKTLSMSPLDLRVTEIRKDGRPLGDFISTPPILGPQAQGVLEGAALANDPYCLSPFVMTGNNRLVLGTPFLRSYFTVFSKGPVDPSPAVSFAVARGPDNGRIGTVEDSIRSGQLRPNIW